MLLKEQRFSRLGFISISGALLLCLAFLLIASTPNLLIPVLLLSTLPLAYIISRFQWQVPFIKILAFSLPFSLELQIFEGSMLRVPGEPLIVLAAAVFLFKFISEWRLKRVKLFKEWVWVLPFMAAYAFTIPFSGLLFVSLKFAMVNYVYIVVFYFFLSILFSENPKLFPQMLLLFGAGMLLVTFWSVFRLWQWEWNPVVVRGIFRPFYKDHTIFGASAALLSAFWFSYAVFSKEKLSRFLSLGAGITFLGIVLFSASRGAFMSIAFFSGLLLLVLVGARLKHLVIIGLALLIIVLIFREPIQTRLQRIEAVSYDSEAGLIDRTVSTGNVTTDVSNIERLNRWVSAWRMFRERPLTGFGPGTYQFEYIPYQEPSLMNRLTVTSPWDIPEGSGGTAHSEYLLAMSEMGVFGILGLLVILGRWLVIAFKKSRGHHRRPWIMVAFLALSTYIFHAFFNNFLTTDKFAFLFWATAAWLISNYHTKNEEDVLPAG